MDLHTMQREQILFACTNLPADLARQIHLRKLPERSQYLQPAHDVSEFHNASVVKSNQRYLRRIPANNRANMAWKVCLVSEAVHVSSENFIFKSVGLFSYLLTYLLVECQEYQLSLTSKDNAVLLIRKELVTSGWTLDCTRRILGCLVLSRIIGGTGAAKALKKWREICVRAHGMR